MRDNLAMASIYNTMAVLHTKDLKFETKGSSVDVAT